jgi:signal transduction histidine kinase
MSPQSDPDNSAAHRGQRGLGGTIWHRLRSWIRTNTFAHSWLPAQLRHPAAGYLAAILVAGAAIALTLLFKDAVPGFNVFTVLFLLAVVMVAQLWGSGPSLLAALVSAALLGFFIYLTLLSSSSTRVGAAISLALLLLVGILISLLTGLVARARQEAEAKAAQLHTALSALEEVKGRLDTFLGVTGHELKTPLTALKLSLNLAQQRLQKAETFSEPAALVEFLHTSLTVTERQAERLERLVQDLVDVSRIQADKLELRCERIDLVALVREAVNGQQQVAPDRCITFQAPPEAPVLVYADPARVEQVVTNYLTNALKYAPAEYPIEVGAKMGHQQGRVWVHDEGPGLPPEEQVRVWEPFHRIEGTKVQRTSGIGLGLGLHICRRIIEQHGGQVGVESAPGGGSTFWFTLPVSSSANEGR